MSDMPKPPYLCKDNKGWKLRRNIPLRLRTAAANDPSRSNFDSHSSIVERERLRELTWADMCKQARTFAVATDLLFDRWTRQIEATKPTSPPEGFHEPGFIFSISEQEAEQIALAYFLERDRDFRATGYTIDERNTVALQDAYVDAVLDLDDARRVNQGAPLREDDFPRRKTEHTAVRLLLRYEYLNQDDIADGKQASVPDWLRSHDVFQVLCRKIEEADVEISQRCVNALETGQAPSITNQFFAAMVLPNAQPKPHKQHRTTLKQLTDAFVAAKTEEGLGKSRLDQYRIPIRLLHEVFGETAELSTVDVERCDEIVAMLHTIPANYTKTYPNCSIKDAVAADELATGQKADRRKAAVDSLQVLRAIFMLAKRRRWIDENPFADQKVMPLKRDRKKHNLARQGYQQFNGEELQAIFSQPLYTGCQNDENGFSRAGPYLWRRHRYWSNILAVWTGARMNEILQLERADLKRHGKLWYISVTDEEEVEYNTQAFQKRLKNPNAVRSIPLHPRLLDYGFIDWAQQTDRGRLFPEAASGLNEKPSILYSKRSATFLKSAGVWQPRKKVFHSYRGTFNNALRNGSVEPEIRELINGWQRQHDMDQKYGEAHKIELMYDAICKLDCEHFDFAHLRPEHWQSKLQEMPRR